MGSYHFEMLNLGYGAYLTFREFCQAAFPGITDQTIASMVVGHRHPVLPPRRRGAQARARWPSSSGLADVVRHATTRRRSLAAIGGAPDGEQWLDALEEAKEPWFWYSTGAGYTHKRPRLDRRPAAARSTRCAATSRSSSAARTSSGRSRRSLAERERDHGRVPRAACPPTTTARRSTSSSSSRARSTRTSRTTTSTSSTGTTRCSGTRCASSATSSSRTASSRTARTSSPAPRRDLLGAVRPQHRLGDDEPRPAGRRYWPPEVARRKRIAGGSGPVDAAARARQPRRSPSPSRSSIMLWGITQETVEEWLGVDAPTATATLRGVAASPGKARGRARVITTAEELARGRDRRHPRLPDHRAELGAGVLPKVAAAVSDVGGHHGPHRDRVARVRPARRGRHGLRHAAHPHGPARARSTATRGVVRIVEEERWPHERRTRSSCGSTTRRRAGGGCSAASSASLAEMTAAGFAVPPGFGITTAAYGRFLAANGLRGGGRPDVAAGLDADDLDAVEAASAGSPRGSSRRASRPTSRRRSGARTRRSASAWATSACRSPCAPAAISEDLAGASFAGQYDTFLWVHGRRRGARRTSSAAGRGCSAPPCSPTGPARPARRRRTGDVRRRPGDGRPRARPGSCSRSTRSPATARRWSSRAAGVWARAVVGGDVTPDRYVVDKVTFELLGQRDRRQGEEYRFDPASGTVVLVPTWTAERREAPCLADDEIAALRAAGQADRAAPPARRRTSSGRSSEGGDVRVLQVRPETRVEPPAGRAAGRRQRQARRSTTCWPSSLASACGGGRAREARRRSRTAGRRRSPRRSRMLAEHDGRRGCSPAGRASCRC